MATSARTKPEFKLPEHVDAKLFWDHDLTHYSSELDDPYVAVSRLYDGPELLYARSLSRGEPGWLPTRYALVEEIFTRAGDFQSGGTQDASKLLGVDWLLNPLEIDPPDHAKYRRVLQPWFQPSAIRKYEPMVRRVAIELISKFEDSGRCDFIEDFASPFPSYIFLELMGLPKDMLGQFLHWESEFMRAPTMERRVQAARDIKDYLESYVEQRRAEPRRHDLVDHILHAEVDGRPMNHGEVMGMCMVLYLGGLDTVLSSLGWHFRYLARHPELQRQLQQDPDLIPGAVEDFLRAFGVTATLRMVTRDLEFHGVSMKQGEFVAVPTYLAGRDPSQYREPGLIDPLRRPRHMTLATGVHNCLGIHLAKRELTVVLEEWLKRFDNIRIPEGEQEIWHAVGVWGVNYLPLTWDRKA
jgi:cytochrome P450